MAISSVNLPVRFQGELSTQAAQQKKLQGFELLNLLKQDTDTYVGQVPAPLVRATGLQKEILQGHLDEIASHIRQKTRHWWGGLWAWMAPMQIPLGTKKVVARQVGMGARGTVYRLDIAGQSYAMKVFHDRSSNFWGKLSEAETLVENVQEVAMGAYYTAQPTKNLPSLHVANPMEKWMLMEFVSKNTEYGSRPGKTLEEQGVWLYDTDNPRNFIGPFCVDYGCLR